jgi:hypothetical protein
MRGILVNISYRISYLIVILVFKGISVILFNLGFPCELDDKGVMGFRSQTSGIGAALPPPFS